MKALKAFPAHVIGIAVCGAPGGPNHLGLAQNLVRLLFQLLFRNVGVSCYPLVGHRVAGKPHTQQNRVHRPQLIPCALQTAILITFAGKGFIAFTGGEAIRDDHFLLLDCILGRFPTTRTPPFGSGVLRPRQA